MEVEPTNKTTRNQLEKIKGINLEEALERFSGNEELYKSILKEFLDECQENLTEIKEALDNCDRVQAIAAAHKLKGTASNISVIKVHKKSQELELALRNATDVTSESSREDFQKLYEALKVATDEFIESVEQI